MYSSQLCGNLEVRNCSLLFASVLYKNLLFSSAFFWGGDLLQMQWRYMQDTYKKVRKHGPVPTEQRLVRSVAIVQQEGCLVKLLDVDS